MLQAVKRNVQAVLHGVITIDEPSYDCDGTHTARDVARYIISTCTEKNTAISNLQLQKILYYVQATFLTKYRRALFTDEIEAWQFGPVVRSVYREYCGYGAAAIYERKEPEEAFSDEEMSLIWQVVDDKLKKDPWDLVEETHAKGKPWDMIYQGGVGRMQIIPKEVIAEYECA